jgi:predicted alpha-1,2-mannosidase
MKLFFISIFMLASTSTFAQAVQFERLTTAKTDRIENEYLRHKEILNYVNPFIGTGGHGHTFPGAVAPFGFMQLSPDTRYNGWDGCSGYHYSDSVIYGFSHTHLSGTGVEDYCDLLIVPQTKDVKLKAKYEDAKNGYGAGFSHKNEIAKPGYYSVQLDNGIFAEMTASERAGLHRYTFPNEKDRKFILIDLEHRDRLLKHDLQLISKNEIIGMRVSNAWATEQHFYFYIHTSVDFIHHEFVNDGKKLLLEFPANTKVLELKVGSSAVDEKGAQNNYMHEISKFSFAQVKEQTELKWLKELSTVIIDSKDFNQKVNFYTALYHSYSVPNVFSDVDGRYRGLDHGIHQMEDGRTQYTVFSLWDTYRATHPWYTLMQKNRTIDFIASFKNHFEQRGDLPVWELAGNETDCMIGYHSVSVIADAYLKGIKKIDVPTFIKAMQVTAGIDELGKKDFNENGFISFKNEPESVSKTLEYAYDSYCIYLFLKEAKKDGYHASDELINEFHKRSFNFINVFDAETGFMRPRNGGVWHSPFRPEEVNFNYTEANSWQYSLYAPQAIPILSNLLGGQDALEKWLDALFSANSDLAGNKQVDITGLIGQYAHGNEPSHHMAYLYNYSNAPEKTAVYVDSILNHYYFNAPDGLSGNEDCGQMSSWYVFSSLGFYPVAPGNAVYDFGRPLFNEVQLFQENGKRLIIKAKNNSAKNKFIQSITIDGKAYKKRYITHQDLEKASLIEFAMGPFPSSEYRSFEQAPSMSEIPENFVAVPSLIVENSVFDKKMKVGIKGVFNNYQYYYTLNGSTPTIKSKKYKKPFTISKTTVLKIVAYNPTTKQYSQVVTNELRRKTEGVSIQLNTNYSKQYAAAGDQTLVDGIFGTSEYRCGDWQGFYRNDVDAVVTFETPKKLTQIGLSTLQSTPSWIFPPKFVRFEIQYSDNTTETIEVSLKEEPKEESENKPVRFETPVSGKAIKQVKFLAKNYGVNPEWHRSPGYDTHLFLDEFYFH